MKSRLVKHHAEERKEKLHDRLGIIFNGEDNLKPLVTESLIDNSPTAYQCASLYQNFIAGSGFEIDFDINLSKSVWEKKTIHDFAVDIAESLSRHQGVFIHVRYNALYEKESFEIIPYTLCRVGEKDSANFAGKIVMAKEGWSKRVKPEDRVEFNVYNPKPEVIQAQVDQAGGWENYKGQVLFYRMNKKYTYPQTLLDAAYIFADTEMHLGLFQNSTVKRGFKNILFIRHKKFDDKRDEDQFFNDLEAVMGAENGSASLAYEDNGTDPNDPFVKFDTIASDEKPDRYRYFEESSANYIRKAFRNIPPSLVDFVEGKLGDTSGEAIKMAQAVYNISTANDRKKLELLLQELFTNYKKEIDLSGLKIKQYSLTSNGTASETEELSDAEKAAIQAQATLKGSVGGVQALLQVQASVAQGITTYDSGVATLMEMYGFPEPIAKRLLGEPKLQEDGPTDQ